MRAGTGEFARAPEEAWAMAAGSGVLDLIPDDWGLKAGTARAAAVLGRAGPDEIRFRASAHFMVILLTPQAVRETALTTDSARQFAAPAGTLEIVPATADFFGRWSVPKENILIGIDPGHLDEIALQEFDADTFELLPPAAAEIDPTALRLARMLREEMQRAEGSSALYVESMLNGLAVHLLREHSTLAERHRRRGAPRRGGLAPRIWRDIDGYMRANLHRSLSLHELAALAGLSSSHFLRAFRETAGMPPHRYLLELRVRHAEQLALETGLPLRDIARQAGFSSQSHMTGVLRRLRHVTPGELRRLRATRRRAEP